jgi:hypothetical protein
MHARGYQKRKYVGAKTVRLTHTKREHVIWAFVRHKWTSMLFESVNMNDVFIHIELHVAIACPNMYFLHALGCMSFSCVLSNMIVHSGRAVCI